MQQEEGILFLLIIALLGICFFAPLVTNKETFKELFSMPATDGKINPQGSYPYQFNSFGNNIPVDRYKWKPGNLTGTYNSNYGTKNSLNLVGTQNSFPYMEQSRTSDNDTKISLIKPDGVVLGGYLPQILRPFDNVTAKEEGTDCQFPCYSGYKHQQWCSEDNAVKYHGMRPLISYSEYNDNLKKLFSRILDRVPTNNARIPENAFSAVFCTENEQAIMDWLMTKIAAQVAQMPEMQRNGPWKTERFYYTDVTLYQFVTEQTTVFRVIFNLFNPLRSVATLVVATIELIQGTPYLTDMRFVNDQEMTDYTPPMNGLGPINGHNVQFQFKDGRGIAQFEPLSVPNSPEGMKQYDQNYKDDPNEFDWNYKNTLEVQKFNKYGFYSNEKDENIEIEGGIPDSLREAIRNQEPTIDNKILMSCFTPKYTGILGSGDISDASGTVKNVYANPSVEYKVEDPLNIRDSKIETISTIYH